DLDDNAVGVEVERSTLLGPLCAECRDLDDAVAPSPMSFDRQPPRAHRFERFHVRTVGDGLDTVPCRCHVGNDLIDERANPRFATSAGSRLRIVPAAVFRGFWKSGMPASSMSLLIRANDARGR